MNPMRATALLTMAIAGLVAALFALPLGNAFAQPTTVQASASRGRLPAAAARRGPLRVVFPPVVSGDAVMPTLASSTSFIVIDVASGAALSERNADRVLPVASLTKLASALVAISTGIDLRDRVTIDPGDLREGSEPILIPGETVTRDELLAASLVGSSNVAIAALARSTGLSTAEFVAHMNRIGGTLGLHQTTFIEPTGLDERNRSTAREVAYLARAAFGDLRIRKYTLLSDVTLHPEPSKSPKVRLVKSTDALLTSDLASPPHLLLGGKTGSLGADTGYHFAFMIQNGERHPIIVVVLGSETAYTRFDEARTLARWTFENFHWN